MRTRLKLIRYLKYLFFAWGLHRFVRPFSGALTTLSNMSRLGAFLRAQRGKPNVHPFATPASRTVREDLYASVLPMLGDHGFDYLEFGVCQGHSLKWWVANAKHAGTRFFGFDTFTGLPEDWGVYKAGDMGTGFRVPDIPDTRVEFIKGLFQDTLPGFLQRWPGDRRKLIHLDADLYTSTLYALTMLHGRLLTGDVLLFDEFAVPNHEYLAFQNYVDSYRLKYEVVGSRNNGLFLAVRVL